LGFLDDAEEFGLLGGWGEAWAAWPIDIVNAGNPSCAEFSGEGGWAFGGLDVLALGEEGGG